MTARLESGLDILVCDTDPTTAEQLARAIRGSKLADWVVRVTHARTLEEAAELLEQGTVNAVFIDPTAFGINEAAGLIFTVRETTPEVVFVLFLDPAVIDRHGPDFDRAAPRRGASATTTSCGRRMT